MGYMSPTVWSTRMMKEFPFAPPPHEKRVIIFPAKEASDVCSERCRRKTRKQGSNSGRHICSINRRIEERDPITFDFLGAHQFHWSRPNGTIVRFNTSSLVNYMLKTGNFNDPESRIPFKDAELQRLDLAAKEAGFAFESVCGAKKDQERFAAQSFRRDALTGLERCAGELVVEMLNAVEGRRADAERGQIMLLTIVFPQFTDLCNQLKAADQEYARHSITQFKDFLAGPPNKPTKDNSGLLRVCMDHIEQQLQIKKKA